MVECIPSIMAVSLNAKVVEVFLVAVCSLFSRWLSTTDEPGFNCNVHVRMCVCMTATLRARRGVRRLLRDSDNKQAARPRDGSTSSAETAVYGQRSTSAHQQHSHRHQCCRHWWSRSTLHSVHLQLLRPWEQSAARGDTKARFPQSTTRVDGPS